jgi:hypothetical protein
MAQIKISALTTGTPQGTDETPATDTTDLTQASSGTTKKFIRSDEFNFYMSALGFDTFASCRVASTVALTVIYANGALGVGATLTNNGAQAALVLDGVSVVVNDRVLIKNQASQFQNGIYTVTNIGSGATNWVLTRATDYDVTAQMAQGDVVLVNQGTINAGIAFQETGPSPITVGTTAIVFSPFSLTQAGFTWNTVTTSQTMLSNNGYITNSAGLITLTLPAISSPGDEIAISGQGTGGWLLAQIAGQSVHIGSLPSSTGVLGSIASANQYDSLRLVCITSNLEWTTTGGPQSTGLIIA